VPELQYLVWLLAESGGCLAGMKAVVARRTKRRALDPRTLCACAEAGNR
jgi:hypothetical protein